jgi:hypothetical protein
MNFTKRKVSCTFKREISIYNQERIYPLLGAAKGQMSRRILHYVLRLRVRGRNYFVLWEEHPEEADRLTIEARMSRFVSARSKGRLLEKIRSMPDVNLANQEPIHMDVDEVFKALAALRPLRALSERKCEILLNGWNLLRDMYRSIPSNASEPRFDRGKVVQKAYDKLFWGNNLPAVTPPGRSYSPLYSSQELQSIRRSFRGLWSEIRQWSGQF